MNEKGMHKQKADTGFGIPEILSSSREMRDEVLSNYTVRYLKCSVDEPSEVAMLQSIETKGLAGEEIILMDRQTYSFEGSFFVVLRYLERRV